MSEPMCECGHVQDEHDPQTSKCLIEQCPCFHFDWVGDTRTGEEDEE